MNDDIQYTQKAALASHLNEPIGKGKYMKICQSDDLILWVREGTRVSIEETVLQSDRGPITMEVIIRPAFKAKENGN